MTARHILARGMGSARQEGKIIDSVSNAEARKEPKKLRGIAKVLPKKYEKRKPVKKKKKAWSYVWFCNCSRRDPDLCLNL